MKTAFLLAVATLAGAAIASNALAQAPMRVVGQAANAAKHVEVEKKFFASLQAEAGLPAPVSYNVSDVLNVKPADALRLVRTGAFDVMSTQIGQAARDDAFFEGFDLVGVATDGPALRKSVEAYRDVFDKRLQAKFNAKVMTLWPFGPQVIYCNGPIAGVQDLKNKKVRVFTASMAALVNHLGGTAWEAGKVLAESIELRSRATTPLQTPLWIPQGIWMAGLLLFAGIAAAMALHAGWLLLRDRARLNQLFGPLSLEGQIDLETQGALHHEEAEKAGR